MQKNIKGQIKRAFKYFVLCFYKTVNLKIHMSFYLAKCSEFFVIRNGLFKFSFYDFHSIFKYQNVITISELIWLMM